ncbi:dephospho-CoA kinase [Sphingobacterium lactis]|uniref:Dephospho-CoA kinase n=1 Tax=Sphingobacterium lactis TaxID=797291 RepID=A0A1H6BYK3_9SPHI|nr:dephospho-CoA kinase [Sphingobacterium lactis]SEG65789.1 dephospho-CoA kinase [Sphingobacterium lactis]
MGLKIGITGGIGVGKSVVTRIFKVLGIPTYDADKEAKGIMTKSDAVRKALTETFGPEVYFESGELNRKWLSNRVFANAEELKKLNAIVHPAVIKDGQDWADAQTAAYSIKEAALLFESGSYASLDINILISSPKDLRITRVMERDGVSREEVLSRMDKQMAEEEKEKLADYIVYNDDLHSLVEQVIALHERFLQIQNN